MLQEHLLKTLVAHFPLVYLSSESKPQQARLSHHPPISEIKNHGYSRDWT